MPHGLVTLKIVYPCKEGDKDERHEGHLLGTVKD